MKKAGLIGGISWVSTIDYYRFINEGVNQKLGGKNFAELVIYSLNYGIFDEVEEDKWADVFLEASENLQKSGAECVVLCANTAHMFADELREKIEVPLIHIAEETAKVIVNNGLKKVGLLGTKFTMEKDFYRKNLEKAGLEVLIPEEQETRDSIHEKIQKELTFGILNPETKTELISISNQLIENGAECLILGCTEIPLIISQEDFKVPVFDTTKIHSQAVVEFILDDKKE